MVKKNKSQSLEYGAFLLLSASVIVKVIGALFKIPLSSNLFLGDLGFGYFSAGYDFFIPIYTLAFSGFPVIISKTVAEYSANGNLDAANVTFEYIRKYLIYLGALLCVLLLLAAFPLVKIIDSTQQSVWTLLLVAPSVIFCFASSSYRGYFEGRHNMLPAAVSNIIEALNKLVLGLLFAYLITKFTGNLAFAAAGAMFGIFIGNLAAFLYLHLKYKKERIFSSDISTTNLQLKDNKGLKRGILLLSVPVIISSLSGSIISLIDTLMVRAEISELITVASSQLKTSFLPLINEFTANSSHTFSLNDLPTLLYGIRSKAFTLFNLIPTLTVAIGVGAIPSITESFLKKNNQTLRENTLSVFKLSSILAFPAAFGFIFLGERVMFLLYGQTVSAEIGGKMLCIYGFAVFFAALSLPIGNILLAVNKKNTLLLNVFLGIVVKIILNSILCSFEMINIFGAVISTVICYILIFTLHIITLIKTVPKLKLVSLVFKIGLSALASVLTAFVICSLNSANIFTGISICVAAIIYFVLLSVLKIFTFDELKNAIGG